jgi:ATP-dependent Clp protease ATP-binding subunit ClpC
MQPPLTDGARHALDLAQNEARALNQEFVGSEHLGLALLRSSGSLAVRALRGVHADVEAVRSSLLAVLPFAEQAPIITGPLPLSPKAQRLVNSAIVMSRSLREPKVSTRVLMISLMEDPGSPFVASLKEAGVDAVALARALAEKPADEEK